MSVTVRGPDGSGQVEAYEVPGGRTVTVQTLAFTVTADGTAGVHRVRVRYVSNGGVRIASLDDLNESAAGFVTTYTYGLGLNASACTTVTGLAVTDALPWTELDNGATVQITAIDDNGNEIAGDSITAVVLQVSDPGAEGADNAPMPFLVPQAA
jgi:hypothetical protein